MSSPFDYPNVTIETIDQAIFDWFDKTVDSHVEIPNADRRKVPVIFSSGERAITSRQRKGIRDANGILILPIISIRRISIDPDPTMEALGIDTGNLVIAKKIASKSNNLQNIQIARSPSKRRNLAPVYEIITIPFPDRTIISYELLIQTQYILQMNAIIEKIFHELEIQKSFLAPFDNNDRHADLGEELEERKPINFGYVVGFLDSILSDSGNFEEFTDVERIIKYNTVIKVPNVLQLDPEGEKPAVQRSFSSTDINFPEENIITVDNPDDLELIFGITGYRKKF